ncbi:DUF2637 domain-containing protein [Calidifontibacter sp. DB0510]|uniref:DUF2637 domain-containing protein n=1 Tax=Metallococcus carri TaxID=1656884 RepID=A0A967AXQ3_9MICO|nr:DUF2637 domain-containing protein [Metallococcus carri]NHN54354.1 DUF2637 domain-containing protein [Metallococcus carri]NOP36806.1 DUF2637 domain-containing protein [Calidifontibacter sp. DB2511S]
MITAVAGTVFIAGGAFWLSFTALADLAVRSGVGGSQAWAWPLIVDGIIVVATVAVVALAGQRSAWYPWALLIGGALVSVTANAIHAVVAADADVPGVLAAAVAAVPPVVLLAITHLTVILTRPQLAAEVPASTDESAIEVAAIEESGSNAAWEPVSAVTPADLGEATALSAPTPQENDPVAAPGTRQASADGRADPQVDAAAESPDRRARAAALRGQGWSNKKIARELGVHPSTVGRWFTSAHLPDTTEHVDAEEARDA